MGLASSMHDARLVARALQHDSGAFGELVRRHFPAVSSIAMAYMRNGADADDVIQDAFIKAWRSLDSLRTPARFGGWVAAIARNTALTHLDRQRSESESLERYRTEAAMANEPNSNAMRDAMRDLLPALVAGLTDAERELVLLRYYAGKKTREIAELLGDSHAAVRKRLERIRRSLGEALLASLTPDATETSLRERYANRVACAAVAVAPEWTHAAARAGSVGTMLTVSAKWLGALAAVGVVAAAGLGALLWQGTAPSEPAAAAAVSSDPASVTSESRALPGPIDTEPTQPPLAPLAPETANAAISGRLREAPNGRGVEGAEINLHSTTVRHAVRTDADGCYAFPALDAGDYWIELAWDDKLCWRFPRSRYQRQEQKVRVAAGESVPDVDFEVLGGVTVRGRVLGSEGAPLDGAVVKAWSDPNAYESETTTNAQGEFELPGFGTDVPAYFWPHHDGYAMAPHGPIAIPAEGLDDLVLAMGSESSISGVLTDGEGNPLTDVRVWAWPEGMYSLSDSATTDSRGQFEARGLHASTYHFTIDISDETHGQRLDESNTIVLGEGEHLRDVRLIYEIAGDLTISGQITDDEGSPQRHVLVWTSRGDATASAETDGDGRYTLEGLEPGTYTVTVQDVSWQGPGVSTAEAEAGDTDVDFTFARPATVRGQVVDASTSQPINQFEVMCPGPAMRWTAFRNPEGAFELPSIGVADSVTLAARADGYATGLSEKLNLSSGEVREHVTIRLERSGRITGRVLDPDARPVRDAHVGVTDGVYGAGAQTDARGEFTISDARPGTWPLRAGHSQYAPAETQVRVVAGETTHVDLPLQEGGRVVGTLRRGETAVRGQRVELTQWLGEHEIGFNKDCTTDEDGGFEFVGVPDGTLVLRVNPMNNGQGRVIEVPLSMKHHEVKIVELGLYDGPASAVFDIELDDTLLHRDGQVNVEMEYRFESGDTEKFYTFAPIDESVRLETLRPGPATLSARYYSPSLNSILATVEPIDVVVQDSVENRFTLVFEPAPQQ